MTYAEQLVWYEYGYHWLHYLQLGAMSPEDLLTPETMSTIREALGDG